MMSNTMLKKRLRVFENIYDNGNDFGFNKEIKTGLNTKVNSKDGSNKETDEDDFGEFHFEMDSMSNESLPDTSESLKEEENVSVRNLDLEMLSLNTSTINSATTSGVKQSQEILPATFARRNDYDIHQDFNTIIITCPHQVLKEEDLFSSLAFYGEIESLKLSHKEAENTNEITAKFYDLRSSKRAFNEISYNFGKLLNTFEREKFLISFENNKAEIFGKFYLMLIFPDNVPDFSNVVRLIELNAEIEKLQTFQNPFIRGRNLILKFYNSKDKYIAHFFLTRIFPSQGQQLCNLPMVKCFITYAERNGKTDPGQFTDDMESDLDLSACNNNKMRNSSSKNGMFSITPITSPITPVASTTNKMPRVPIKFTSKTSVNYSSSGKENKTSFKKSVKGKITVEKKGPYKIVYDQNYSGIKKRNTPDEERKKYIIDIENIVKEKDSRTTLMIKNIPTYITQVDLLKLINKNYSTTYNFFYLPIDFNKKLNAGYAFINFRTSKHIINFFLEFDNKPWNLPSSNNKICYLSYARIQGFKSIREHFHKSNIMKQVDQKVKPIIFLD